MAQIALAAALETVARDALVKVLDGAFGQGLPAHHDLEAVVVRRIVAAGHRHAATGIESVRRVIDDRRGHGAKIDHVDAGFAQSIGQRPRQLRAGKPAVTPHHDFRQAPDSGGHHW